MFKRIGTPVDLSVVSFNKKKDLTIIKCASCESVVGRRSGTLVKFSNSTVVVVSPEKYICPKCGKTNSLEK